MKVITYFSTSRAARRAASVHADNGMELLDKLSVLADAAKYDAACTSSGAKRGFEHGKIGCTSSGVMGCCHSFSADGRCITLLKVLLSNDCMYDCKYCVNRRTNETRRATFTPEELAELTIQFYRRNYIEGLFLSSGVLRSPDYTTELMIRALVHPAPRIPLQRLHPRQGHPRRLAGAGRAARAAGRPPERQHRAAERSVAARPRAEQDKGRRAAAHGAASRDRATGKPARAGQIPSRAALCPRGAEPRR